MQREKTALQFYSVDYIGENVWNAETNKYMSIQKCKAGYKRVYLTVNGKRGNYGVGRLVATKYVTNPNPEIFTDVNHKNGNKSDDDYENVEWVTKSENQKHAYANNLQRRRNNHNKEIDRLTKENKELKNQIKILKEPR